MKTLKTFEFKAYTGPNRTYDWDAILSGQVVQLEEGEDYACKRSTVIVMAKKQAEKRGKVIRHGHPVDGSKGIVLQAVSPEDVAGNGEAVEEEAAAAPAPKKGKGKTKAE